jgi:hypothetical protein
VKKTTKNKKKTLQSPTKEGENVRFLLFEFLHVFSSSCCCHCYWGLWGLGAVVFPPSSSQVSAAALRLFLGGVVSVGKKKDATGEDRTHDLGIMRPTRCRLRYARSAIQDGST